MMICVRRYRAGATMYLVYFVAFLLAFSFLLPKNGPRTMFQGNPWGGTAKNTQKEWQKDKEQGPRTLNWGVTARVNGWALAARRTVWTSVN